MKNSKFNIEPHSEVGMWLSLRNNNYNNETALHEFIDNVINYNPKKRASITIQYDLSKKSPKKNLLTIKDNVEGIKQELLSDVFKLGRGSYVNPIKMFSEHGFGMKAAMLTLGDIYKFKTKSDEEVLGSELIENNINDKCAGETPILHFEQFEDKDWQGTEIVLNNVNTALAPYNAEGMKILSTKLGSTYARFIDIGDLEIRLIMNNLDSDKEVFNSIVHSHHRVYAHGTKRDKNNAPVREADLPAVTLKGKAADGTKWELVFEAGYKPTDADSTKMGLPVWPKGSPYSPIGKNIGFDVYKNGRIILRNVLSENFSYSGRGNYIQGEIHIKEGIVTTTTKNAIKNNPAWKEALAKIVNHYKDQRLDDRVKTGFKKVRGTELMITNRIAEALRQQTLMHEAWGIQDANREIQAFKELWSTDNKPLGEGDILIAPTAKDSKEVLYEVKKEEADTDAVRQLFGYMFSRNITRGILASQKMTSKAKNLMDVINKRCEELKLDFNIRHWDYTTLNMFN
mgnify:FL=1